MPALFFTEEAFCYYPGSRGKVLPYRNRTLISSQRDDLSICALRMLLFCARFFTWSLNFDILIEKCSEIKTRKTMPKINRVVVGVTAPSRAVSLTSRSCQTTRRIKAKPVSSHNHEYSTCNFLLRTREMITTKMDRLVKTAKIF